MIKLERFKEIENEVRCSFNQALDKVKELSLGNYILFISNSQHVNSLEKNSRYNPPRIDDKEWFYKDKTRLIFLTQFLNIFYFSRDKETRVEDESFRINLELMIYCHVWESSSFLDKMYRLAHLTNGEEYVWNVEIPEMGKHDFIRNEIKEIFIKQNLNLGNIIPKGFHSQLRNAFAHSQYDIDLDNKRIKLENYKNQDWEFTEISTDNWSERFVYSIWMSYSLFDTMVSRRQNLIDDLGTDTFSVRIPSRDKKMINEVSVRYSKDKDSFESLFNR